MLTQHLSPKLGLLTEEYVLVQAWKKTASYIRNHNWYADTLELDRVTVNLPYFLEELAQELSAPERWQYDPIRIVPAPKSQKWKLTKDESGLLRWGPIPEKGRAAAAKLRPLAHVSLKDQVAATAVMLCLADRVETMQGDPRNQVSDPELRRLVTSYGNRLFCDSTDGKLQHRWGSGKLYRAFYQDYRNFLARPEIVAESLVEGGNRLVIVHSDLKQFYDRVRPNLLTDKLHRLVTPADDPHFFDLAYRLFQWTWDVRDASEVGQYAKAAKLDDFSSVALPQGLVSAGFFANVVLLDFDRELREMLSTEIHDGIVLADACRYVDDLRLVLSVDSNMSLADIEDMVTDWVAVMLDRTAHGLIPSEEKTRATEFRGNKRPLVRQSRKMERIQKGISGGFDAIGGVEILDAIQGLIRSQQRYSEQLAKEQGWSLAPIPDVRDATVSRFAAGRFRNTYRSLRPLLEDIDSTPGPAYPSNQHAKAQSESVSLTQADLDSEARTFALELIENWVEDPSNVRLLRIGLDLWPDPAIIRDIFRMLEPFTRKGGSRGAPRRVAWYCLSEIFRAGAIETGFVYDKDCLPSDTDIHAYHAILRIEAMRLMSLPSNVLPWYLKQQVLLYLNVSNQLHAPVVLTRSSLETKHYVDMIRFLGGDHEGLASNEFATLAVLARQSLLGKEKAVRLVEKSLTPARFESISKRDPSFALELLTSSPSVADSMSPRLRADMCIDWRLERKGWDSLAGLVLHNGPTGPLRNELSLLHFADKFLAVWRNTNTIEAITPSDVALKITKPHNGVCDVEDLMIVRSRVKPLGSMYKVPEWCLPDKRWRFQLGYLMRFILAGTQDFTRIVHPNSWKEDAAIYKPAKCHWYERRYGLYSGHSAFGDDWLPISDFTEKLLFALLGWPGSQPSEFTPVVDGGLSVTRQFIQDRIRTLRDMVGKTTNMLMLPQNVQRPDRNTATRTLRACVLQTILPTTDDFAFALASNDLSMQAASIRKAHRNHLSAALAAIERMLVLRETHMGRDNQLDWLILPELAVHPRDVHTHLVPFARKHKTIVLAGLTYEELFSGQPLINSAIWVIPEWSPAHGLQIRTRRQGKHHLSLEEEKLNAGGIKVQGFRPCQWLVGYEWSNREDDPPIWLTAAICYDATDLSLAADLRLHSDVFAIPALNKDVATFDQMALALHYHMFQMVIVANNGLFGGSNAYVPRRELYKKQIFHLHGQPQATVAFMDIDEIQAFKQRKRDAQGKIPTHDQPKMPRPWKYPPAGI